VARESISEVELLELPLVWFPEATEGASVVALAVGVEPGVLFEEADGEEELPESETSSVDDSAVVLSA